MDIPLIPFLISIFLFFPVLYFIVIPVMQQISLTFLNTKFKVGGFSPQDYLGDDRVGFYDVLLTYICFALSLAITMVLVLFAGRAGIIKELPMN